MTRNYEGMTLYTYYLTLPQSTVNSRWVIFTFGWQWRNYWIMAPGPKHREIINPPPPGLLNSIYLHPCLHLTASRPQMVSPCPSSGYHLPRWRLIKILRCSDKNACLWCGRWVFYKWDDSSRWTPDFVHVLYKLQQRRWRIWICISCIGLLAWFYRSRMYNALWSLSSEYHSSTHKEQVRIVDLWEYVKMRSELNRGYYVYWCGSNFENQLSLGGPTEAILLKFNSILFSIF